MLEEKEVLRANNQEEWCGKFSHVEGKVVEVLVNLTGYVGTLIIFGM